MRLCSGDLSRYYKVANGKLTGSGYHYATHVSRLKANSDFQRVRREGRSWSHPLIVLIARANDLNETRIGIAASKTVGSAVVRNRAKRRLREAVRRAESTMVVGWDVLLVARPGLPKAKWLDVTQALSGLLNRATLLK